jgi:hypothetical protein
VAKTATMQFASPRALGHGPRFPALKQTWGKSSRVIQIDTLGPLMAEGTLSTPIRQS